MVEDKPDTVSKKEINIQTATRLAANWPALDYDAWIRVTLG